MSEKSFAAASISVAFVWGTFFYPPAPHQSNRVEAVITATAGQPAERTPQQRSSVDVATLGLSPVALNTSGLSQPAPDIHNASLRECAIGAPVNDHCTPMHKLAGH